VPFSVLDPLLAVVALSTGHTSELYWRLSRNWHARLQLRNQWRINRSDSSSGSSKLQRIDASPKGDGLRTIPKSASSVFSMRALEGGKQPTFWNRTIPSESILSRLGNLG
jgi:hypothetical protein